MIPYFHLASFHLGPLTIYVWGLMAALGFGLGLLIAWQEARRRNLNVQQLLDLAIWLMIAALFFSRLFYVFFGGEGDIFLTRPWLFFALWHGGLAAIGGFFGAGLVLVWFGYKNRRDAPRLRRGAPTIWPYLESLAYAFPFGWLIGRLGCFLIHDHPGRLTNSFLGVNFPNGARFDLGLLEMLALLPLTIIFLFFSYREKTLAVIASEAKQSRPFPFYAVWLLLWYGATRFFLDFLRATDLPNSDPRFWSLTLGQWGSLGLVIIGIFLLIKKTRRYR